MNSTQEKSVPASKDKSKKPERKSRQEGYRKKFGNRPHMIMPEEDLLWLKGKNNQVKELFIDCWTSDPYGSRWMPLSHSLKPTSFRIAKKALNESGLFLFRQISSIRDAREKVYWEVLNLHGSRVQEYWLAQKNEVENTRGKTENATERHENARGKNGIPLAISSESYTQSQSQNPSETSQERLSNSSKELLETLVTDPWEDDRDRNTALEGRVTSASSEKEKRGQQPKYPEHKQQSEPDSSPCREFPEVDKVPRDVTQKSLNEYIEQARENHPHMSEEAIHAVAQKLAIEAEQTTEEYQSSSEEAAARLRAFAEGLKKKAKEDRDRRLRGDLL